MKKHLYLKRIISCMLVALMIAILLPIGNMKGVSAADSSTPPNLRPGVVEDGSNMWISLNGNLDSKTLTYLQYFPGDYPIKIRLDDSSVASASYKTIGSSKYGRAVLIILKFKKLDDVFVYVNAVAEDKEISLPVIPHKYEGQIKTFTIGKKTYKCDKSFSYSGKSFKNQKVTVTPKKNLKVDFLYVVDNNGPGKSDQYRFKILKKYKNGSKITVPDGCSLHVSYKPSGLSPTCSNFCLFTANSGKDTGYEESTDDSNSKKNTSNNNNKKESTSSSTPSKVKITKVIPKYWGSGSYCVEWKMQKGVTGYELLTALSKDFKVGPYTMTYIGKYDGGGLSNLPIGKTIYFKVRAFTTVNGKKKYGKWSDVKSLKIS